jgi:hypothetical protein
MTSHVLDYDLDSVLPFVQTRMGGLDRSERMTAISLRRDRAQEEGDSYCRSSVTPANIFGHNHTLKGVTHVQC